MKRRIGRACVLIATVAILFFYPFLAPPAHRIDETHLNLIRDGMTEAEVEGIFGVPAGEYDWAVATGPSIWVSALAVTTDGQRWNVNAQPQRQIFVLDGNQPAVLHSVWNNAGYGQMKTWTGRHGAFYVVFDRHGRVISTGSAGETRREYPWSQWWQQWTGK
jgi:hypothetical protein